MSKNKTTNYYDGKIAGLYDLGETLGRGHFAVVKVAKHVFTGEQVAVKVIDKTKLDDVSRAHLFQEVRCMKLVQHPNVVRLYEVIDTQTKLYLILELGDGGDMYDYIMRHDRGVDEDIAKRYFRQIVSAISYCHKLHVVHRDLKPENVVFFEKLGVVKLTDFGFSNKFLPGQKLETSCGSLAYSAPEILLGDSYDAPKVDVWSLGVLLYMLVSGHAPFQEANDSETLTKIMDCKYTVPPYVSEACNSLISRMLVRDPEKRCPLEKIIVDPWLDDGSAAGAIRGKLPLLQDKEQLSEEDRSAIVHKMVAGNIATKDEINEALERNDYNHITATYFLLAERKLRSQRQPVKHSTPNRVSRAPNLSMGGLRENSGSEGEGDSSLLAVPKTGGLLLGRKCSIVREEDDSGSCCLLGTPSPSKVQEESPPPSSDDSNASDNTTAKTAANSTVAAVAPVIVAQSPTTPPSSGTPTDEQLSTNQSTSQYGGVVSSPEDDAVLTNQRVRAVLSLPGGGGSGGAVMVPAVSATQLNTPTAGGGSGGGSAGAVKGMSSVSVPGRKLHAVKSSPQLLEKSGASNSRERRRRTRHRHSSHRGDSTHDSDCSDDSTSSGGSDDKNTTTSSSGGSGDHPSATPPSPQTGDPKTTTPSGDDVAASTTTTTTQSHRSRSHHHHHNHHHHHHHHHHHMPSAMRRRDSSDSGGAAAGGGGSSRGGGSSMAATTNASGSGDHGGGSPPGGGGGNGNNNQRNACGDSTDSLDLLESRLKPSTAYTSVSCGDLLSSRDYDDDVTLVVSRDQHSIELLLSDSETITAPSNGVSSKYRPCLHDKRIEGVTNGGSNNGGSGSVNMVATSFSLATGLSCLSRQTSDAGAKRCNSSASNNGHKVAPTAEASVIDMSRNNNNGNATRNKAVGGSIVDMKMASKCCSLS